MTIDEIKEIKQSLAGQVEEVIKNAKSESRDLTEEEAAKIKEINNSIDDYNNQIIEIENNINKKNIEDNLMELKNKYVSREIRNMLDNKLETITFSSDDVKVQETIKNTVSVGDNHDAIIETEVHSIMTPIYEDSLLSQLGVRFETGIPMGDHQYPIQSKMNAFWLDELESSKPTAPTYTVKYLRPKRIGAYVDLSEMLIRQDTLQAEAKIRKELVDALNAKLESTIFGTAAGSDNTPAGLFYGKTIKDIETFKDVTNFEAALRAGNYKNVKYAVNPWAVADLRNMPKSSKSTQLVMENGAIDGKSVIENNYIPEHKLVLGDWSNLVVGIWGDITLKMDDTGDLALQGKRRFIISAYVDYVVLDENAFNFGNVPTE